MRKGLYAGDFFCVVGNIAKKCSETRAVLDAITRLSAHFVLSGGRMMVWPIEIAPSARRADKSSTLKAALRGGDNALRKQATRAEARGR